MPCAASANATARSATRSCWRAGSGVDELYVADLDAIAGAALQSEIIAALAREARVMVDAGAGEPQRLLDLGVDRVVIGTETLTDADALPPDAVLSVDLYDGRVLSRDPRLAGLSALDAVARLPGPREVIVLDLARVGTGVGTRCRARSPSSTPPSRSSSCSPAAACATPTTCARSRTPGRPERSSRQRSSAALSDDSTCATDERQLRLGRGAGEPAARPGLGGRG